MIHARGNLSVCMLAFAFVLGGCGSLADDSHRGESGQLAVFGNGPAALQAEVGGASLAMGDIFISETAGQDWTSISEHELAVEIASGSSMELVLKDLPSGEYHGLRIDLMPGFQVDLVDGSNVEREYPDILMYIQGGMYRYSSADNGFPETNQYFLFTTRNAALAAPIVVETDEKSFLVVTFEPRLEPGGEAALAARAVYTYPVR